MNDRAEERLGRLFKESFGVDRIEDTMAIDSIEGWDSMGHVALILALEKEFGVVISPLDAVNLSDVGRIKSFLRKQDVR